MKLGLLLLVSPLLLSGCVDVVALPIEGDGPRVVGTGKAVAERRRAEAAKAIDVSGAFTVEIRKGAPSLQIEAQREILPHVKSKFEGGCLHVWAEGDITTDGTMRVRFTTPSLSQVRASGATNVDAETLMGDLVRVELSGASKLRAAGRADRVEVEVAGASEAQLKGVETQQAKVEATGASKASVTVRKTLWATASGASTIRFYGKPQSVSQDASGVSSVRPG